MPLSVTLLGSAVLIAGVWLGHGFLTSSDRFAIRTFDVRGHRALTSEQIIALLDVAPGENIFRARIAGMIRALESNPWIAGAQVRRSLPSTLIIEVDEHEPAALVELDSLYLADPRGRVFKRAAIERGEGIGLPVITGLAREDYLERPDEVHEAVRNALETVALYRERAGRPAAGEVHVHPRHGITLLTRESALAVRLGSGDPALLRARLHAFDRVWDALTPDERARAQTIYADEGSRSERVTVAFGEIE